MHILEFKSCGGLKFTITAPLFSRQSCARDKSVSAKNDRRLMVQWRSFQTSVYSQFSQLASYGTVKILPYEYLQPVFSAGILWYSEDPSKRVFTASFLSWHLMVQWRSFQTSVYSQFSQLASYGTVKILPYECLQPVFSAGILWYSEDPSKRVFTASFLSWHLMVQWRSFHTSIYSQFSQLASYGTVKILPYECLQPVFSAGILWYSEDPSKRVFTASFLSWHLMVQWRSFQTSVYSQFSQLASYGTVKILPNECLQPVFSAGILWYSEDPSKRVFTASFLSWHLMVQWRSFQTRVYSQFSQLTSSGTVKILPNECLQPVFSADIFWYSEDPSKWVFTASFLSWHLMVQWRSFQTSVYSQFSQLTSSGTVKILPYECLQPVFSAGILWYSEDPSKREFTASFLSWHPSGTVKILPYECLQPSFLSWHLLVQWRSFHTSVYSQFSQLTSYGTVKILPYECLQPVFSADIFWYSEDPSIRVFTASFLSWHLMVQWRSFHTSCLQPVFSAGILWYSEDPSIRVFTASFLSWHLMVQWRSFHTSVYSQFFQLASYGTVKILPYECLQPVFSAGILWYSEDPSIRVFTASFFSWHLMVQWRSFHTSVYSQFSQLASYGTVKILPYECLQPVFSAGILWYSEDPSIRVFTASFLSWHLMVQWRSFHTSVYSQFFSAGILWYSEDPSIRVFTASFLSWQMKVTIMNTCQSLLRKVKAFVRACNSVGSNEREVHKWSTHPLYHWKQGRA